jgi:mRNA interferase RelE/StbE
MIEILALLLAIYLAIALGVATFGPLRDDIDREIRRIKPAMSGAKALLFRLITALAWPIFLASVLTREPPLLDMNSELEDEPAWIGNFDRARDRLLDMWEGTLTLNYEEIGSDRPEWTFGFSAAFRKAVANLDKKLQGRVLEALAAISRAPTEPRGDTQKPLRGAHAGLWRYRLGDYRLVYQPELASRKVLLVDFGPRGDIYD